MMSPKTPSGIKAKAHAALFILVGIGSLALGTHAVLGAELNCDRSSDLCELRRGVLGSRSFSSDALSNPQAHEQRQKGDRHSVLFELDGASYELHTATLADAEALVPLVSAFAAHQTEELHVEAHRSWYLVISSYLFGLALLVVGAGYLRS